MKKLFLIMMIGTTLFACNADNNDIPIKQGMSLSADDVIPKSDMEFDIDKSSLNNNIVSFTFAHGGGCDPNHNFKLYYKPKLTTDCVVDTLFIVFSTKDGCKRQDFSDWTFDLSKFNICSKKLVFKGGRKNVELTR